MRLPWDLFTRAGRKTIACALVAGLLLRAWFILRYAHVSGDSLIYGDIAQNILAHGVYGFTDGAGVRPTLIRLPGYPAFLLVCFRLFGAGRYMAVLWVQAAFDLWTCLLLAATARRMFNERAAVAALWLGTLCPFMANYVALPLTETLTLWCMGLAFYALVRCTQTMHWRWIVLLGGALGYAILLRPEQGLLAAACVPAFTWIGLRRTAAEPRVSQGLVPTLVVCLLTMALLVPWTVRNYRTFHVFQPLAPRYANDPGEVNPYGFQRWYRTWAIDFASTDQVYWLYDGAEIQINNLPNRAFDSSEQYAATEALLADYNETTTASPALDQRFNAIASERIKADPLRFYVALPMARMLNMTLRPRVDALPVPLEWWQWRRSPRAALFAGFYALLNLGYLLLAARGLAIGRRWQPYAPVVWAMVATILMRMALLLTLDNSEPRYTLEFFPVLIVLGAGALAGKKNATSRRHFP